ncbi:XdhC family protein [Desulfurococcaceae archaeon MEX13E-LK6-19]|nr:XdhC family protein [Desulfurococcaceae archaeon MEX13E-LK6-19]
MYPKFVSDKDLFEKAVEALEQGLRVCIAVIVEKIGSGPRGPGAKIVVLEDGRYYGTLGGGPFERMVVSHALQAIKEGKSRLEKYSFTGTEEPEKKGVHETGLLCGGTVTVFFDVLKPKPTAFIVGVGKIGKPLADIMNLIGAKIVALDPNRELLKKEVFPYAELYHGTPEEIGEYIKENARPIDMVFIVHGETNVDVPVLKKAVESKAGFIGVLGSKRKVIEYAKMIIREGVKPEDLRKKVRAPIGIDIGAKTPEEIAVSIAAQAIAWLNNSEKEEYKTLNILMREDLFKDKP